MCRKQTSMLEGKQAVIFDLDGTLADSMGVWGQIDIDYLGAYGLSVPEGLQREVEGMGFTEVAVYFKNRFHLPESIETIKQTWQDMAMEQYSHEVALKPGSRRFVEELKKRGFSLAVASSNHQELIRAVLDHHGILSCFDAIITSCEVQKGKPAPDVYLRAAQLLDTEPSACLVFEDIVAGIQAGKAAGMEVCAVHDAYSVSQEKEKRASADYYIQSYDQVLEGTYEERSDA